MNEIYESAEIYSNTLSNYSIASLKSIKTEIEDRKEYFSEEEIINLYSIIENYKSSTDKQISMLNQFKEMYIDDGTTIEEKIDSAKTDYNDGKELLDEIELNYNIEYEEPETEY